MGTLPGPSPPPAYDAPPRSPPPPRTKDSKRFHPYGRGGGGGGGPPRPPGGGMPGGFPMNIVPKRDKDAKDVVSLNPSNGEITMTDTTTIKREVDAITTPTSVKGEKKEDKGKGPALYIPNPINVIFPPAVVAPKLSPKTKVENGVVKVESPATPRTSPIDWSSYVTVSPPGQGTSRSFGYNQAASDASALYDTPVVKKESPKTYLPPVELNNPMQNIPQMGTSGNRLPLMVTTTGTGRPRYDVPPILGKRKDGDAHDGRGKQVRTAFPELPSILGKRVADFAQDGRNKRRKVGFEEVPSILGKRAGYNPPDSSNKRRMTGFPELPSNLGKRSMPPDFDGSDRLLKRQANHPAMHDTMASVLGKRKDEFEHSFVVDKRQRTQLPVRRARAPNRNVMPVVEIPQTNNLRRAAPRVDLRTLQPVLSAVQDEPVAARTRGKKKANAPVSSRTRSKKK